MGAGNRLIELSRKSVHLNAWSHTPHNFFVDYYLSHLIYKLTKTIFYIETPKEKVSLISYLNITTD